MRAHRRPVAGLEPIPLGLHARRGRSAAPATAGLLSALPVRLQSPATTGIHGLTPSVAHLYRNRLLVLGGLLSLELIVGVSAGAAARASAHAARSAKISASLTETPFAPSETNY